LEIGKVRESRLCENRLCYLIFLIWRTFNEILYVGNCIAFGKLASQKAGAVPFFFILGGIQQLCGPNLTQF
jgi:hypothetical protein